MVPAGRLQAGLTRPTVRQESSDWNENHWRTPWNATILIADDDCDSSTAAQDLIPHYEVLEANGADALELALSEKPDCVVLDVMMPELNGWEVCKTIRSHEEYNSTGILMVTAIGETLNDMTSELYGADDHVNKPFELQEVLTKVEEIISKHQADSF